jgi:hypothetical protein
MSKDQILPKLKAAYTNLDLRFLCLFAGVLDVSLIWIEENDYAHGRLRPLK